MLPSVCILISRTGIQTITLMYLNFLSFSLKTFLLHVNCRNYHLLSNASKVVTELFIFMIINTALTMAQIPS